ncbi:MAG: hypothetical protein HZA18_07445 [Nitrospirae bacterium]|nr:hypothetical protein [Nitrospirota bacterium]MBI5407510.1 hypothetical protein [Nitrospirota bacterium]
MKKGVTIIAVLAIAGVAIFFYLNSHKGLPADGDGPPTYLSYKNNVDWSGGETKPIVSTALFTGMARQAYAAAAMIPEVLDRLYCYCYCAEDHGHKSLRTCFTEGHGANCDTCINEAILAQKLHEKGASIQEIRESIDSQYYRPYREN